MQKHKLRLAFVALLFIPLISWAQLPESCDAPDAPTPEVDGVQQDQNPHAPSGSQGDHRLILLDSRYVGFGDRHYVSPFGDVSTITAAGLNPYSVMHRYDTHDLRGGLQDTLATPADRPQSKLGNIFSSFNVNAAFRDDMWPDIQDGQATDFAQRTVHMLGGQFFAMSALESGDGLTRSEASRTELNGRYDKKYTIGSLSHGAILRGMTSVDEAGAIGASHHASANFNGLSFLTTTVPS